MNKPHAHESKNLQFIAMTSQQARAFQEGALDANGQLPERYVSKGGGIPCRHCLQHVAEGNAFLALAFRPFDSLQPYAELGPIFLHADSCERYEDNANIPELLLNSKTVLLRGYTHEDRILYGSGQVVASSSINEVASKLFENPKIAYIHVRSATNNCFTCRIERAG